MRRNLLGLTAVVAAAALVGAGASAALADEPSNAAPLPGSVPSWADTSHRLAAAAPGQRVDFRVYLGMRDAQGAEQAARDVSDPASPGYRHFLTPAQVRERFAPTAQSVSAVQTWLRGNGFQLAATPANELYVEATGTVDQVQRAFQTTLGEFSVQGRTVRGAQRPLAVPRELAGAITGVVGVNQAQNLMRPTHTTGTGTDTGSRPNSGRSPAEAPAPPPPGFRNAGPCSAYWDEQQDTADPAYPGVPNPMPYAPCGYTPSQFRDAYGLSGPVAAGMDGSGQTVAIVDAFASPTLFADAQQYSQAHDPRHVLRRSQFDEIVFPPTPGSASQCDASGWYGEQSLDVEAVHGMAPGAHILYVGGADCQDLSLDKAVNEVVSNDRAQIISNSYGNSGESLPAGDVQAFEEIATQAALQGIGLYFSSGDAGDDAATNNGVPTPDFAASSPWVTAVGGTSVGIDQDGHRIVETGWETGKSTLANGQWTPPAPGAFGGGSGGGTSRLFAQPSYQQGVVPDALATKNRTDGSKGRVVPDVSMDADPNTGMLIGLHQTFPDGVYYSEYRIGGTSLACPLLAGEMAISDQVNGRHGFLNPLLYQRLGGAGLSDVEHDGLAVARVDYQNLVDASGGLVTSARNFDYQKLAIATTSGYDDVTGLGTPAGARFLFLK